ncbi:MAG: DUF2934 domain-containing protein [Terriglobales bacterium]
MKRIESERPNLVRRIPGDLEEQVRQRAYEIYQERGGRDGSELGDWLQAEAEVLDNQHSQRAA